MRTPALVSWFLLPALLTACNNEQDTRRHIQSNQALMIEKQNELSDLSYKVTRNSLRVGTNDYDSTIGKNFNAISAAMQFSIDSLKAETDSLEALLSK